MKRLIYSLLSIPVILLSLTQFAAADPGVNFRALVLEITQSGLMIDIDQGLDTIAIPATWRETGLPLMILAGVKSLGVEAREEFMYDLYRSHKVPWPRSY